MENFITYQEITPKVIKYLKYKIYLEDIVHIVEVVSI